MSADGIHGNIEKKAKIQNIYDYNDLKAAVASLRKNLDVVDVTTFCKQTKKRRHPSKNTSIDESLRGFLLKNVVEVRFTKGSTLLPIINNYSQVDFLQKEFQKQHGKPEILPEGGVLRLKKNTILSVLGPSMPIHRLYFFAELD